MRSQRSLRTSLGSGIHRSCSGQRRPDGAELSPKVPAAQIRRGALSGEGWPSTEDSATGLPGSSQGPVPLPCLWPADPRPTLGDPSYEAQVSRFPRGTLTHPPQLSPTGSLVASRDLGAGTCAPWRAGQGKALSGVCVCSSLPKTSGEKFSAQIGAASGVPSGNALDLHWGPRTTLCLSFPIIQMGSFLSCHGVVKSNITL